MENDVLEVFRKIKVPWWARVLGWWRARRLKKAAMKKRHYIVTINVWWLWSEHKCYVRSWYICFEHGDGKRSYEYRHEASCTAKEPQKDNIYAHVIAPWLAGGLSNARIIELSKVLAKQPDPHK